MSGKRPRSAGLRSVTGDFFIDHGLVPIPQNRVDAVRLEAGWPFPMLTTRPLVQGAGGARYGGTRLSGQTIPRV